MTKQEALDKIKELEKFIKDLDESIGFDDDKIFLLSIEEYKKYIDEIPHMTTWWWLRSPGYNSRGVAFMSSYGYVGYDIHLSYDNGAVRPALKYTNLNTIKSKDKDCFVWNETKWKIIDEEKKIAISCLPITFERFDNDSNDYASSEIREWLLNWFEESVKDEID